jgi:hypothetical protein
MLTQTIRIGVGVRGVLFGSFLDKQKGTLIKAYNDKSQSSLPKMMLI